MMSAFEDTLLERVCVVMVWVVWSHLLYGHLYALHASCTECTTCVLSAKRRLRDVTCTRCVAVAVLMFAPFARVCTDGVEQIIVGLCITVFVFF